MAKIETLELKFLLRLLGVEGYRSKISGITLNKETKAVKRDQTCEALGAKGLVEYDSEIAKFAIASPGTTLLKLDTTSLPVTPDELQILKACKGPMTPGSLGKKVPASDRQRLLANLAERGLIKVSKNTIKEVWLSAQGKQFLLDEYEPKGNSLMATATMLGHYIQFMRENLGPARRGSLPTHQPQPQRPLSQPGSLSGGQTNSAMPIGSQTKPDKQAVLHQIQQLDQQLDGENYLPIYYLRSALQPPLNRSELDSILYALQRDGKIDLDSLHDQGKYTQEQVAAGILQDNGGYLFFITVS